MSESYQICYFNGRGRGETARLVLAASGKKFDNLVIEDEGDNKNWPGTLKETMPFGQVPALKIKYADGKEFTLAQSLAIVRYLSRKFNLMGSTPEDAGVIDSLLQQIEDFRSPASSAFWDSSPSKEEKLSKFVKENLPKQLAVFSKFIEKNSPKKEFLFKDTFSVADISLYREVSEMRDSKAFVGAAEEIAKFPLITALLARVEALPNIAAYLKTRKSSEW